MDVFFFRIQVRGRFELFDGFGDLAFLDQSLAKLIAGIRIVVPAGNGVLK